MSEFTIELDDDAATTAEGLVERLGLAKAVGWSAVLAAVVRGKAEAYQQELSAALGGPPPLDAAEQRRPRASRPRPAPPTTTQEVEERVRTALDKPRTMRALGVMTRASHEQLVAALAAIGATRHGQKWTLSKEQP